MQIARVRLFSLFGAMLFLLNLLTSNVIYHNICILSTLILRNLMYLKSIDELPTPLFRSLHSSLIIAFHYLPSPFITFHRLSLPFIAAPSHCPHTLCSPPFCPPLAPFCPHLAPFCPRLAPFCPHLAPFCPHLAPFCLRLAPFCPHLAPVLSSPCPILSPPRPALSPCPLIPPLHTCFPPASSPLLFHTSVFHAPLSAPPFFYSLCFTPSIVFTLSHCFTSFVLFLPPLLYSLPLFYTALLYSLPLFTPPSLYLLPLFCTRFFTPRQPPQTRPRHRKRQRFSHFSKKFCKKPLTKQKKVLY